MSLENLIGSQIRSYQILAAIGRGGSAVVYKAHDEKLDRLVAVKMLHAFTHHPQRQKIVDRFRRGAQAAARLKHPNILPIYDFGEWQGTFYVVMQYVAGRTLKQTLLGDSEEIRPTKPLSLSFSLDVTRQVGAALAHAHKRGIIHRDVKPSNILMADDGGIYLTDFGLAHVEDAAPITQSGETLGTPHYMSPEQGRGLPVDHRSDIYSLGVVLFHMLTGQVPFDADTPAPVILKHMVDPLPSPRSLSPDIPPPVEVVLRKALTKNPSDRYQRVQEFVYQLEKAVTGGQRKAAELAAPTAVNLPVARLDETAMEAEEKAAPSPPPHDETLVGEPVSWVEPTPPSPLPVTPKPPPSSLPEPPRARAPDRTAELKDYAADTGPLASSGASGRGGGMKWAIVAVISVGFIGLLIGGAGLFFWLGGLDLLNEATATPTVQAAVVPTSTGAPVTPTPTVTPTTEPTQTGTVTPIEPTEPPTRTEAPPSPTAEPPTATPTLQLTPTPTSEPMDTPTVTPTGTSTQTPTATATLTPSIPTDMVLVPAGDFIQGSSNAEIDAAIQMCEDVFGGSGMCPHPVDWFTDETPRRTVYLDTFYIDKWEVTNEAFAAFVAATGYATDAEKRGEGQTWRTFNTPGREKHPVIWMSWNDADAYCAWREGRLPTEAEWEKAARGADGRIWPWGSNWEPGRSNTSDGGAGSVAAVGSYPASASPYGLMDVSGNVWEWVADWYDPLWYSRSPTNNPSGPSQGVSRVLRGGAFGNPPWEVRAVHRHSGGPGGYAPDHGFRCAK